MKQARCGQVYEHSPPTFSPETILTGHHSTGILCVILILTRYFSLRPPPFRPMFLSINIHMHSPFRPRMLGQMESVLRMDRV